MADVKNEILGATGLGMATAPGIAKKMADTPFYETNFWLSAMAIMGAGLIIVSLVNALIKFKRNMGRRGESRDNAGS